MRLMNSIRYAVAMFKSRTVNTFFSFTALQGFVLVLMAVDVLFYVVAGGVRCSHLVNL